jgi:hypothetical protein
LKPVWGSGRECSHISIEPDQSYELPLPYLHLLCTKGHLGNALAGAVLSEMRILLHWAVLKLRTLIRSIARGENEYTDEQVDADILLRGRGQFTEWWSLKMGPC